MSCASIMTRAPASLHGSESLAEAAAKLFSQHHPDLPVVDDDGRFIGMFGIDDLLELIMPRVALAGNLLSNRRFIDDDPNAMRRRFGALKDRKISEFAHSSCATVEPETPQIDAVRLLCLNRSALPVVEKKTGKVVGMVSRWDVLRGLLEPVGV